MPPAEPTPALLASPWWRYLLATRPRFLTVTLVAALIGLATPITNGLALAPFKAFISVFFALVAHGGVNVLNDYYDELPERTTGWCVSDPSGRAGVTLP